jgi:hypothetical protein
MAKPTPKDGNRTKDQTAGRLASILPLAGFGIAAVSATLLALSTLDFLVVDLRPVLHGLGPVFALSLIAAASMTFLAAKRHSSSLHAEHGQTFLACRAELEGMFAAQKSASEEAATAHRTQLAGLVKEVSQKVDTFIGSEHARLKEENDRLRSHLEGLQRQDAEKIAGELDTLRQKNAELEERITQWAVGSIDSRIERKTLQAA